MPPQPVSSALGHCHAADSREWGGQEQAKEVATPVFTNCAYSAFVGDGSPPHVQDNSHAWEMPCCSGDRPQLSQYSWARVCCPACTSALTMLA